MQSDKLLLLIIAALCALAFSIVEAKVGNKHLRRHEIDAPLDGQESKVVEGKRNRKAQARRKYKRKRKWNWDSDADRGPRPDFGELCEPEECGALDPECPYGIATIADCMYNGDTKLCQWENVRCPKCQASMDCESDQYCSKGYCRDKGSCGEPRDCQNPSNTFFSVGCEGHYTCDQGMCGVACNKVCPEGAKSSCVNDDVVPCKTARCFEKFMGNCVNDFCECKGLFFDDSGTVACESKSLEIVKTCSADADCGGGYYCAQGTCSEYGQCQDLLDCLNPSNRYAKEKCFGRVECTNERLCNVVCDSLCPDGIEYVGEDCPPGLCELSDCGIENVHCVDYKCGGCNAIFFGPSGKQVCGGGEVVKTLLDGDECPAEQCSHLLKKVVQCEGFEVADTSCVYRESKKACEWQTAPCQKPKDGTCSADADCGVGSYCAQGTCSEHGQCQDLVDCLNPSNLYPKEKCFGHVECTNEGLCNVVCDSLCPDGIKYAGEDCPPGLCELSDCGIENVHCVDYKCGGCSAIFFGPSGKQVCGGGGVLKTLLDGDECPLEECSHLPKISVLCGGFEFAEHDCVYRESKKACEWQTAPCKTVGEACTENEDCSDNSYCTESEQCAAFGDCIETFDCTNPANPFSDTICEADPFCFNNKCICANYECPYHDPKSPPIACMGLPCEFTHACEESVACYDHFCGGCSPVFVDGEGTQVCKINDCKSGDDCQEGEYCSRRLCQSTGTCSERMDCLNPANTFDGKEDCAGPIDCMDGMCVRDCLGAICPADKPFASCENSPCDVATCKGYEGVSCVNDYCGGCFPIFFNEVGLRVCDEDEKAIVGPIVCGMSECDIPELESDTFCPDLVTTKSSLTSCIYDEKEGRCLLSTSICPICSDGTDCPDGQFCSKGECRAIGTCSTLMDCQNPANEFESKFLKCVAHLECSEEGWCTNTCGSKCPGGVPPKCEADICARAFCFDSLYCVDDVCNCDAVFIDKAGNRVC